MFHWLRIRKKALHHFCLIVLLSEWPECFFWFRRFSRLTVIQPQEIFVYSGLCLNRFIENEFRSIYFYGDIKRHISPENCTRRSHKFTVWSNENFDLQILTFLVWYLSFHPGPFWLLAWLAALSLPFWGRKKVTVNLDLWPPFSRFHLAEEILPSDP